MRPRGLVSVLVCLGALGTACGSAPSRACRAVGPAPEIAAARADSRLAQRIELTQRELLSSPERTAVVARALATEVGPRMAGSEGDRSAVAWTLRTMSSRGLEDVRAEPVSVPVWRRGRERGFVVAPSPAPLTLTMLGWSHPTPKGGLTAPVVRVADLAALGALAPEKARGRIVLVDAPTKRARDGSGYAEAVAVRYEAPAVAHEKGAVAVLIRSVGTGSPALAHTGSTKRDGPPIPVAALSSASADALTDRLLHGDAIVRLELESERGPDAASANVIGEVAGASRAGCIVLLGAHLDSWDLGQGAVDDAAGVAAVVRAAEVLAKLPERPSCTVRVVLFAAEESSSAGAKEYARAHASELPRHVGATEIDAGTGAVFEVRARATDGMVGALARAFAPLRVPVVEAASDGGADIRDLADAGVPIVSLYQDMSRYFDIHHTTADRADAIEAEPLAQAAAAAATFALVASDGERAAGPLSSPRK